MNPALLELLLSAVLLLELPAVVSSLVLGMHALRMEPRPRKRWIGLSMLVGLSIPWAGAVLGVILGSLLGLILGEVWMPMLAGLIIGVLYLQLRWTQLILAEWREGLESEEDTKDPGIEETDHEETSAEETSTEESEPSETKA